ncbi:MAG: hypothetical protein IJT75_05800 [Bacteroidaceae bacterium]|nr:hypothetical protein [Bacteroidaceae bacterium]
MWFGIIIGLLIWFVLPIVLDAAQTKKRKKKWKRAIEMTCRIVGIVIIVVAVLKHFLPI